MVATRVTQLNINGLTTAAVLTAPVAINVPVMVGMSACMNDAMSETAVWAICTVILKLFIPMPIAATRHIELATAPHESPADLETKVVMTELITAIIINLSLIHILKA